MDNASPSAAFVSLEALLAGTASADIPEPGGGCGTTSAGGKASCGSSAGQGEMPDHIWDKVKNHPCYSEEAHHHFARMHVAVAPACNIQCNYCNRKYDCANESRPGVVSEKLTPEQAARKVAAVAAAIPQMSVLGVAGPGDPLANPKKTFQTFELVAEATPDIKLCLSTNGLALPDHVDRIAAMNVDHVTITINAIDPDVGAKIYPWIFWDHRRITGREAAEILIRRQLQGLEMLTERGILAKINSVMIPGVNDEHLIEVNKAVKARGAFLHNIMPLISEAEHGTVFGLTGQRGPTAKELKALQDACEGGANMMRHCRQCRADAVGLLGEDRSEEFTTEKVMEMDLAYDLGAREAYQSLVEQKRAEAAAAKAHAMAAMPDADIAILIAVATKGGGLINEHFGHAREFQIYEVTRDGAKFVGHRRVDHYCQGGFGEDSDLGDIVRAINDCVAVFVSMIGHCPKEGLEAAGIEPVMDYALELIAPSALAYYARYVAEVRAGTRQHDTRGDASIRQGAFIET